MLHPIPTFIVLTAILTVSIVGVFRTLAGGDA